MNTASPPLVAVTMGDPSGIGPEIIVKALQTDCLRAIAQPLVIASRAIMEQTLHALGTSLAVIPISEHELAVKRLCCESGTIPVLDPFETPLPPIPLGHSSSAGGAAAVQCIRTAVRLALAGLVDAVVTAPINKRSIHLAGYHYPGHTEMLAHFTGSTCVGMMIVGGPLKVMFVTTHVPMRELPNVLSEKKVIEAIQLASDGLRDIFQIERPRIGVAGFNPHAGEDGLFGDEERRYIMPAVQQARSHGLDCTGPLPADTLFGQAVRGTFDAVVAMYHDQGLIALKTLAFGRCVNVTVGLPIIRTSVDHGTAYDIVGKGIADPTSLIEAMTLAAHLATHPNAETSREASRNPSP